jgi:hypothetical protein
VLQCGAYTFSTSETTTRFLWADYNSSDTTLKYAHQTMTLSEDAFNQEAHDALAERLSAYTVAKIHSIPLPPLPSPPAPS